MKRLGSSDSLGALMSICRATDENGGAEAIYGRELQSMLDADGCGEELALGGQSEKKRRLSVKQVKALEKNFEVENKLEPERKLKLAQELGLQPRQVAVWFQNRRARWKTKQLERDYGVLRANYDSLKLSFDALKRDKDTLLQEIDDLKSKLNEENTDRSDLSVKVDVVAAAPANSESEIMKLTVKTKPMPHLLPPLDTKEPNHSSDSDTSAILAEENATSSSPSKAATSSAGVGALQTQQQNPMMYQLHYVKLEEHNFFGDEACNFFSDEQAPTLHWYCSDQWN